jgi:HEAT repeat protein
VTFTPGTSHRPQTTPSPEPPKMTESMPSAEIPDEPDGQRTDKPMVGWRRYIHSFVIIPAFVALLFVALFYVLSSAGRKLTVADYLQSIREGNHTVRWQSALELSKLLADPSQVPDDDEFLPTVLKLFNDEALYQDEPRVRLFLSLAMGRTGSPECFDPLMSAMEQAGGVEEQSVYIRALGFLGDTNAVDVLLSKLNHTDTVLRHEAVQALGFIGAEKSRLALRVMLKDPEPNVRWDAAVALAKMKDNAAKPVLMDLLDRDYYAAFPDVRPEGRTKAMETAAHAAAFLNDPDLNVKIKQLSESDPNIRVRGTALEIVQRHELD